MTTRRTSTASGFTLAEVCVAIAVCALFGAAAFTTNQRLLVALKSQKETTAATMSLQQRMELLRATAFSNIATPSYVQSSISANATGSEAPLGNLSETITVTPYPQGSYGSNVIRRNAAAPNGTVVSSDPSIATAAAAGTITLLRVDVVLDWTSANARARERQLSSVFGIGNIAP
jgi:type II secretory pathway pseudopilin PulG